MRTIIFIITITFLTSCGIFDSNDNAEDYFPLHVGNKWYYSHDNSQSLDEAEKWEIIGEKSFNNNKYFLLEKTYLSAQKDTSYLRKDNNKLIELFIDKSKNHYYLESTFADFSIIMNKSFNYYSETFNDKDYYFTVSLKKVKNNRITLLYDVPQFADEEHSITFEVGKGITEIYNFGWSIRTSLIHYELK